MPEVRKWLDYAYQALELFRVPLGFLFWGAGHYSDNHWPLFFGACLLGWPVGAALDRMHHRFKLDRDFAYVNRTVREKKLRDRYR